MGIGAPTRPPAGGKGAMNVPGVRNPGMGSRPPVIQPGPGVGPRPPVGGKGGMPPGIGANPNQPIFPSPFPGVRPPAGGKGAMGPTQLELIQKQLNGTLPNTDIRQYPSVFDPNQVTTGVLGPMGDQKYTNQQMIDAFNAYKLGGTSPISQTHAENFFKNALATYGPQQMAQYYPNQPMPLQSQLQPTGANELSIARPAGPLQPSPLAGLSALDIARRIG